MIAEILATGDEIRNGSVVNTNSAFIAESLESIGVTVARHHVAGDDLSGLSGILKEMDSRADIAVICGGLGPTPDDLSREAAADAFNLRLVESAEALESVKAYFEKRNRPMPDSNTRQALLPEGADCILNDNGTAPGFFLTGSRCRFFFVPGVPAEMRKMVSEGVLTRIDDLCGAQKVHRVRKTFSLFGLPESATGEKMRGFEKQFPGISLGFRAKFPVIQVKLWAFGKDRGELDETMKKAALWSMERIGRWVFSEDGLSMEAETGRLLNRLSATVAVAESCTGGLIGHWLTSVAGSSDYFLFSGVTYDNDAKIKVLGVSPDTLASKGAVSEEVAIEMARGAKAVSGADYAVSTSGIAGPGGGSPEKPVGTVCIGLAGPGMEKGFRFVLDFKDRAMNKTIFAMSALEMLRKELVRHDSTGSGS